MKVCDKCKNEIANPQKTLIKGKEFEICSDCAEKIIDWLKKKETNFFKNILNQ